MSCFFCKGTLKQSTTTHIVSFDNCIIVIKDVPCEECAQCGEAFYSDDVAAKLETAVKRMKAIVRDIAVFEYDKVAA